MNVFVARQAIFDMNNEVIACELLFRNKNIDKFIIGSLFIMGIYHFALYYKRSKYKAPLYLGIFCLIISLRNSLVGERVIFI